MQVLQQIDDLRLHRNVQRRNRFVANHEFRIHDQGTRDTDALPLPAGKFVREAFPCPDREADQGEHIGNALGRVGGLTVDRERFGHDVFDRHARVQRAVRVLKDNLHRPADFAQRLALQPPDILTGETDRAVGDGQ